MANETRNELGDFLRSRREALPAFPVEPAISARRRRTPGWRREEVAEAAGISVDWYTRLEQGRAERPSLQTAEALSRALQLDETEQAHLLGLLGRPPVQRFQRETVDDSLQRIVHSLNQPAYVTGARWDVLVWNSAAAQLLTDFSRFPEDKRNLLVYMFTDAQAQTVFGATWAAEATRMLGKFRGAYDKWAGDPEFVALVEYLSIQSPLFAQGWNAHTVVGSTPGLKTLTTADGEVRCYEYAIFHVSSQPALRLAIYTPFEPALATQRST